MFYLRMAWRNLWRNKRRTIITISMVLFAVVLSTSMKSVQKGVYDRNIHAMVSFSSGYIQVADTAHFEDKTLETSMELTPELLETIKQTEGVENVLPRIENMAWISSDSSSSEAIVLGTDVTLENQVNSLSNRIVSGSYFSDNQGILLSVGLANRLQIEAGDSIVLLGMGFQGMSAQEQLKVSGIVEMGSPRLNKRLLFMPLPLAQQAYSMEYRVSNISVLINDPKRSEEISATLNELLQQDIGSKDWQELIPELAQLAEGDAASGNFMMFFLYIIISFGVFGTVLMMLSERKREFGVVTAIGMKRWKLGIVVFLENVFISAFGALLGMLVAIPVITWLKHYPISLAGAYKDAYEKLGFEPLLTADYYPEVFLFNGIAVFTVAVLLSIYPLVKLSRLRPIEYLRG